MYIFKKVKLKKKKKKPVQQNSKKNYPLNEHLQDWKKKFSLVQPLFLRISVGNWYL